MVSSVTPTSQIMEASHKILSVCDSDVHIVTLADGMEFVHCEEILLVWLMGGDGSSYVDTRNHQTSTHSASGRLLPELHLLTVMSSSIPGTRCQQQTGVAQSSTWSPLAVNADIWQFLSTAPP